MSESKDSRPSERELHEQELNAVTGGADTTGTAAPLPTDQTAWGSDIHPHLWSIDPQKT